MLKFLHAADDNDVDNDSVMTITAELKIIFYQRSSAETEVTCMYNYGSFKYKLSKYINKYIVHAYAKIYNTTNFLRALFI